ncbi:hypothetical protein D3C86_1860840 [compost metagenome]
MVEQSFGSFGTQAFLAVRRNDLIADFHHAVRVRLSFVSAGADQHIVGNVYNKVNPPVAQRRVGFPTVIRWCESIAEFSPLFRDIYTHYTG